MIGKTLGHYEVVGQLGKGGMGEVYRARDSKLGREVAIKVLPPELAQDAERLSRMEREARMLASLNHPNIAAIYGLEQSDDTRFLVLELVEGNTLADRIAVGAVPVGEALPLAIQIAEALEAAHEKGVIHRDLKPANIKVTPDGKVKVLDFGLAKAFEADVSDANLSNSPTLSLQATQQGFVLGTAAYMSPEQARGRQVDKRTDVWAFGAVVYEMLAGRRCFVGDDVTDTLAAVLRSEPDWDALPDDLPATVRKYLERCLVRDVRQRVHDVGDVRLAIEGAFDVGSLSAAAAPVEQRRGVSSLAICAAAGALIVGGLVWFLMQPASPEPPRVARFTLDPAADGPVNTVVGWRVLASSLDGERIAYASTGPPASRQIFIRRIDELEATALRGTESGVAPFFSPDGESLGFVSGPTGSILSRVSVLGGPPVTVASFEGGRQPWGMHWTSEESILFTLTPSSPLLRIDAAGGDVEELTTLDEATGETYHGLATVLPDRDTVLFTIYSGADAELARLSLATGEVERFGIAGTTPTYVSTGHVLYLVADGTLRALPFDIDRREFTSTNSIPVVEDVFTGAVGDSRNFALTDGGDLVYLSGTAAGGGIENRILAFVDADGRIIEEVDVPPGPYVAPRVSPNGQLLAVQIANADGTSDIWIKSMVDDSRIRQLTLDGQSSHPLWTPDSTRVTYASVQDETQGIFWQPIAGGGAERLTETEAPGLHWPESWSPDGQTLGFTNVPASGLAQSSVWTYSVGDGTTTPLPVLPSSGGMAFSPDGEWFAYHATRPEEAVPAQLYLQPFPPTGADVPITPAGGTYSVFSPVGGQLIYRRPARTQASVDAASASPTEVVSIDLRTENGVTFGGERILETPGVASVFGFRDFDPTPDGQRFLMALYPEDPEVAEAFQPEINVVLNWIEELKERVPIP